MYPQRKFDLLGREYRTDISQTERVFRSYWENTKNIKVRYHIYNQDVKLDVFDFNGKTIMTNESGKFKIQLSGFWIDNYGQSNFKVLPKIITEWSKLLKKE